MIIKLLATTLLVFSIFVAAGGPIPPAQIVPHSEGVLPNGFRGEGEWDTPGALQRVTDNGVDIRLKQNDAFLFIGVRSLDTSHTGIDLYIEAGGRLRMLHVSTAHGERSREDSVWSALSFGRNQYWTANIVQMFVEDGRQIVVPPDIFEFQIDKKLLLSEYFSLMVILKRPELVAPAGAVVDDPATWLGFVLADGAGPDGH